MTAARKEGHASAKFSSVCWHLADSLVSIPRIIPKVRRKSRGNNVVTHSHTVVGITRKKMEEEIQRFFYYSLKKKS